MRRSFLAHHQGTRGRSKRAHFQTWFTCRGVEHFYLVGLCGRDFERSRKEGEPDVRFDAAGNGNPDMVELMRHSQRKRRAPARLDLRPTAPFPDPTTLSRPRNSNCRSRPDYYTGKAADDGERRANKLHRTCRDNGDGM